MEDGAVFETRLVWLIQAPEAACATQRATHGIQGPCALEAEAGLDSRLDDALPSARRSETKERCRSYGRKRVTQTRTPDRGHYPTVVSFAGNITLARISLATRSTARNDFAGALTAIAMVRVDPMRRTVAR